jgi:hypothetical protein
MINMRIARILYLLLQVGIVLSVALGSAAAPAVGCASAHVLGARGAWSIQRAPSRCIYHAIDVDVSARGKYERGALHNNRQQTC